LKGTTSFDEIIGAVQQTLDGAARGELPADRVLAARDHLLNQTILGAQTPAQVAVVLAVTTGATGDVHGFERYLQALAAVKPEDVARVAKILSPARRSVVTLMTGADAGEKERGKEPAKGGAR